MHKASSKFFFAKIKNKIITFLVEFYFKCITSRVVFRCPWEELTTTCFGCLLRTITKNADQQHFHNYRQNSTTCLTFSIVKGEGEKIYANNFRLAPFVLFLVKPWNMYLTQVSAKPPSVTESAVIDLLAVGTSLTSVRYKITNRWKWSKNDFVPLVLFIFTSLN